GQERRQAIDGVQPLELLVGAVQPDSAGLGRSDCDLRSVKMDQPCEMREGSWLFTFTPGVVAEDAVGGRITLNEVVAQDGLKLTIHEIRLSSSEVLVAYSLDASGRPFRPAGPLLELVHTDGTISRGGTQ